MTEDPEFPRLQFWDQLDQFEHDQVQEEYGEQENSWPLRRELDEDESIERERDCND